MQFGWPFFNEYLNNITVSLCFKHFDQSINNKKNKLFNKKNTPNRLLSKYIISRQLLLLSGQEWKWLTSTHINEQSIIDNKWYKRIEVVLTGLWSLR